MQRSRIDAYQLLHDLDHDQSEKLAEHLLSANKLSREVGVPHPSWVAWPQVDPPKPNNVMPEDFSGDVVADGVEHRVSAEDYVIAACEAYLIRLVTERIREEPGLELSLDHEPRIGGALRTMILEALEPFMTPSLKRHDKCPFNWTRLDMQGRTLQRLEALFGPEREYRAPTFTYNPPGSDSSDEATTE